MNILVVGLGYVGAPLAAELSRRGHDVWSLRRSDASPPPGVRLQRGDATAELPPELRRISFDQVVVLLSAGERSEAAYERTYVGGASNLRAAFPRARLVWVSSTAVYADDGDATITDETVAHAAEGTPAILLRAEAAVAAGPYLIVRPSGIYGPARTRLLERLIKGEIAASERDVWTNRIHREDLVSALALTIDTPALRGTLLASDPTPAQLGAMQDWVQSQLSVAGSSAPPPSTSPSVRRSRRIHASRLSALGFSFRYPSYREGYAQLLGPAAPRAS